MALSRTPGPVGFQEVSQAIDPGTLARMPLPPPGPIGLRIYPKILMVPKAVASRQLGITVHQQSQISAQEWVKKINDSDDVPDYFKEQIKSKGNVIYVTNPKQFKVPTNVISKDWLDDWLSAFTVEEWEMTTGCLNISVKKGDSSGPLITIAHNPDLSSGETIDGFTKYTMTVTSRGTKSIEFERGNTLPTGVALKTGRKLIAVANRVWETRPRRSNSRTPSSSRFGSTRSPVMRGATPTESLMFTETKTSTAMRRTSRPCFQRLRPFRRSLSRCRAS